MRIPILPDTSRFPGHAPGGFAAENDPGNSSPGRRLAELQNARRLAGSGVIGDLRARLEPAGAARSSEPRTPKVGASSRTPETGSRAEGGSGRAGAGLVVAKGKIVSTFIAERIDPLCSAFRSAKNCTFYFSLRHHQPPPALRAGGLVCPSPPPPPPAGVSIPPGGECVNPGGGVSPSRGVRPPGVYAHKRCRPEAVSPKAVSQKRFRKAFSKCVFETRFCNTFS